ADLPALRLTGALPAADSDTVLALPTRPGEPASVVGAPPVDVTALLAREKARGEAGELLAVPGEQRVLLLGTGDGTTAALRKAGAAVARRAKGQPALVVDLRGLSLTDDTLTALAEGLLLASYGFTTKEDAEPRALRTVTLVVPAPDR